MDNARKKKRGRRKIFKCLCTDDEPASPHNPEDYASLNPTLPKPLLIAVPDAAKGDILFSDDNFTDCDLHFDVKKSSSGRRIARIFKAVFFDAAVMKKIGSRRSSKTSIVADNNLSSVSNSKIGKQLDKKISMGPEYSDGDDSKSSSRRSNLFSSPSINTCSISTSCSSSLTNSNSLSDRKGPSRINSLDWKPPIPSNSQRLVKKKSGRLINRSNNNMNGLCLFLLVSLFVLVMWGRVCAILCTSTWFYLGSFRRISTVGSPAMTAECCPETDSEQYKKRIIMEGLLSRSRNQSR